MEDGGLIVINEDDPNSKFFYKVRKNKSLNILSYGYQGKHLKIISVTPRSNGQRVFLEIFGSRFDLQIPLIGAFQVQNLVCATAMAIGLGADVKKTIRSLNFVTTVPGRLELVAKHKSGASVYVDYAHSPDALCSLLKALRLHAERNLIVVFGCGGDRDHGKRQEMGLVASNLADIVFVTDDNPRTEDPREIRKQIMSSCKNAMEIDGRKLAITAAIKTLKAGDILVVAGKGHESHQIVGKRIYSFSDKNVIKELLG